MCNFITEYGMILILIISLGASIESYEKNMKFGHGIFLSGVAFIGKFFIVALVSAFIIDLFKSINCN